MTLKSNQYGGLLTQISVLKNTDREAVPGIPSGGIKLSPEQSAALMSPIKQTAGICAGAGAGKTRLLVERAARLVASGVEPGRILVVTFTRKSAEEIRERIKLRLGSRTKSKKDLPSCATVHSVALTLLRKFKEKLGEEVLLPTEEQAAEIMQQLRDGLIEKPLGAFSDDEEADDLDDEEMLMLINKAREDVNYYSPEGLVAARYEKLLAAAGLTDFTGLLTEAVQTMKGGLYDYILVDEAQDLSKLQRMFITALGAKGCHFWYIGDADQAIYSFRGAHAGVMNELASAAEARYDLSMNYRCTTSVVEASNRLISKNSGRIDIEWRAHRTERGSVMVREFSNCELEYETVKAWLQAAPTPGSRMALARTQSVLARLKEEELPACSVHESKGLEWDEVWVMGCEQSLFPHRLCTTSEERRLFYVAMTRAKNNLIMSYTGVRIGQRLGKPVRVRRQPSKFLFEAMELD